MLFVSDRRLLTVVAVAIMLVSSRIRLIAAAIASTSAASTTLPTTGRNETMAAHYEIEERGALHSVDYRIYFKGPNGYVSPWHDVPMFADASKNTFNLIVEIPRWTNAKMEMAVKEPLNPIRQDEKNGVPRFVNNCFPHHGYICNYGAIPQTWEDPTHIDPETKAKGDNDPIDVCEIGSKIHPRGSVVQVKVLGTLALIDQGETDWKVFTIDVNDPLAEKLNDIDDVEKHMPGLLNSSVEWFRTYKIPAGKPANAFAFNGQFKNREYALKVIAETNRFWKDLVKRTDSNMALMASSAEGSVHLTDQETLAQVVESSAQPAPAKPIPDSINVIHFISD